MPDKRNLNIVTYPDFYYSPGIIKLLIVDNFDYLEFIKIIKSFEQVNTNGVE